MQVIGQKNPSYRTKKYKSSTKQMQIINQKKLQVVYQTMHEIHQKSQSSTKNKSHLLKKLQVIDQMYDIDQMYVIEQKTQVID